MEDIALHVLDIMENSLRSGAGRIEVRVETSEDDGTLVVEVEDDGAGMTERQQADALDPFYTSKPGKKVGLGLPLFRLAAEQSGGSFSVHSVVGSGTKVRAVFGLSHPDRQPLGDMVGTVALFRAYHPEVEISLEIT